MRLSLKFRYTRKLLHLPRCRGDSAAFDATRNFGLKLPKDFKLGLAAWQHPSLHIHTNIIMPGLDLGGGEKKRKSIFSDASTQRK